MQKIGFFILGVIVIGLMGCGPAKLSIFGAGQTGGLKKTEDPGKSKCEFNVQTVGVFPFFGEVELANQEKPIATLTPWEGQLSAEENFNDQGPYGLPIMGPRTRASVATHFIYKNQKGMYLYLMYDTPMEIQRDGQVDVWVNIVGNELKDKVIVADESGEVREETDGGRKIKMYYGNFIYQTEADAMVIGPLVGDQWEVRVAYKHTGLITQNFFGDNSVGGLTYNIDEPHMDQFLMRPMTMIQCDLPKEKLISNNLNIATSDR